MKLLGKIGKRQPDQAANGRRGRDPQRRQMPAANQSRMFSYYAARSQAELNLGREAQQSKPPIRRLPTKFQRLRKHGGWLLLGLFLLAFAIYDLQLSTTPKVVALTTSADTPFLQPTQVYQQSAQSMFAETASNRNKLTVNAEDIANRLQRKYPELQSVSVSLPVFGATPVVYIRPAQPALVLAASNGTYIIDENGRALTEVVAGTNVGRLHIPSVTDQSGLGVELGEQVLPRSVTTFISTVTQQLGLQKITIQSMTLPAAAGELDVYVANKPYFIKFNTEQGSDDAALVQVGTYLATMNQLRRDGVTPAQYIDVRLQGRAYYK